MISNYAFEERNFSIRELGWASLDFFIFIKMLLFQIKNRMPYWFWQRTWEYPYIFSNLNLNKLALDVGATYPWILTKNKINCISVDNRHLPSYSHKLHGHNWDDRVFLQASVYSLPFNDNSFDQVFCISTIEEFDDPVLALTEMIRVAKKSILLTIDIGDNGLCGKRLESFLNYVGTNLPRVNNSKFRLLTSMNPLLLFLGMKLSTELSNLKVLYLVIDKTHAK